MRAEALLNLTKLFLLMVLLGGAGGTLGSIGGSSLGKGGVFAGGLLVGTTMVVAGAFLGSRWHWIKASERAWTIIGGVSGFVLATMVTLSTLGSAIAPALATVLIGTGAVLGALVGHSAHEQS